MTVINGIEIDYITYSKNEIKEAINNNEQIEDKLHVITVISNPCLFAKRYILMKEFINRLQLEEPDVIVYIVELCYGDQKFLITDKKNKRHLQLRTQTPLWHKENMINLGVKKLLPEDWKAFAWIDADIEFDSVTWARDTLKILNGCKDIVQLFSHAADMNHNQQSMTVFNSAGYQYSKGLPFSSRMPNLWHPGFAWAINRRAYEKIGGLYEKAILGSGDNIMMLSLIGKGDKSINSESTEEYIDSILEYELKIKSLRFGYVPGLIRHYFHGSKINRKYQDRWQILIKHNYNPVTFITKDKSGIIIPTKEFPELLKSDIYNYFLERNEDSIK
jgi:hypothetical protein